MPTPSDLFVLVSMAAAAGLVGSVAVMRRMTLASDALSHVALPGIALAILLHADPLAGGLCALLLGTLLVWGLEGRTRLPTEAIIGVVFSAALAVGSMMATGDELIEALFGTARSRGLVETWFGLAAAAAAITFVVRRRHALAIRIVSSDLALATGIDVRRLDLWFLLAFALAVAMGLRYLGVLLMGSLIIIPASTARMRARSMFAMQSVAVALAIAAALAGALFAAPLRVQPGPLSIVFAAAFFLVGLAIPRSFGPRNGTVAAPHAQPVRPGIVI